MADQSFPVDARLDPPSLALPAAAAPQVPARQVRAAGRARRRRRPRGAGRAARGRPRRLGRRSPPSTTAALLARIRDGGLTRARAARARAAVVARAGRARAPLGRGHDRRRAPRARPRRRDEPRRRHPPRRPRLRARLLPVQRRRGGARGAAPRGPRRARAGGRLRRAPGRRDGADLRRRPAHVHALAARRAQLPVHARRPPTSTSTSRPARATSRYLRALDEALDFALDARAARLRLLPRRRRPVGGRPARPARAHQGRACARATSWCSTGSLRRRRAGLRRARRRLRGRRRATRSTSTPRPPRRSRAGPRA